MVKRYEIGGKAYTQKKLVLGQLRQLMEVLQGTALPVEAGAMAMVAALGERLPLCLAVVLTEEGRSPAGKDLPALADEIEFSITPETVMEVVEDFFGCNPIVSLLDRATAMIGNLSTRMMPTPTASSNSSSSSPEATSPNGTASSGDADSTR